MLLRKLPEEFWALLDAMTLSVYPNPHISDDLMCYIQSKASEHDISLNIKRQDQFQHMTIDSPRDSFDETRTIFQSCWLRHRCHMLREGRFYLCTRPCISTGSIGRGRSRRQTGSPSTMIHDWWRTTCVSGKRESADKLYAVHGRNGESVSASSIDPPRSAHSNGGTA